LGSRVVQQKAQGLRLPNLSALYSTGGKKSISSCANIHVLVPLYT
jgi:hypothetical protein